MRAGRPRSQGPITPPLRESRRSQAARRRLMRWGGSPGFEWSRGAAAALSRGRKPMEQSAHTPEPRRRRQHLAGRQPPLAKETRAANP